MPCRQCGANLPENASFCHMCGASDPIAKTIVNQDPLIGKTLNRQYRITKKLGEGGFGAVYEAEEPRFERKVAIKTIHEKLAENAVTLERFRREGMAASKLEHPAAVKIYNLGETDDGLVFMAMEFIEGSTLSAHLHQNGALAARATVELLAPIFEVLAEAHSKGIIHRDLKPQNMMLSNKRGATLRLLDFGISKVASAKTLTQTSTAMGTPAYMAPEQWEEGKNVGPAADLYAMGLIVYQCVTGVLPFEADTAPGWMKLHCLEAPKPLHSVLPSLPVSFCDAVMRALSKKPSERFQDATSFLMALQRSLPTTEGSAPVIAPSSPDALTIAQALPQTESRPQEKKPPSGPNTLPGVSGRSKNLILFGVSAALLIGVSAFFALSGAPERPTTTTRNNPPKTQPQKTPTSAIKKIEKTWSWSNPKPQGNRLRDFFKLSDKELFIVGDVGAILRSQDGGGHWEVASTPANENLRELWMTQQGSGFAVGNKGTILRTTDHGASWSHCPSPISEDVIGVWSDPGNVVILSNTKALRSADCTHWESASLELPKDLASSSSVFRSLFALHDSKVASDLWVVGDEGLLFRSKDAGKTWERTILPSTPDEPYQAPIMKMAAAPNLSASYDLFLLRQDSSILVSEDLGLTWRKKAPSLNAEPIGFASVGGQLVAGTSDNVWVLSGNEWKSTFTQKEAFTELFDLYGDERGLWSVGTFGRILFSPDGFSWEERSSQTPRLYLRSIYGTEQAGLFAVGKDGLILRSADNGETWLREEAFFPDGSVVDTSIDDVIVVGAQPYAISNQSFLTRTEKGWTTSAVTEVVHSMLYAKEKFYLGGYDGTIFSSNDQGKSWATELALGADAGVIEALWQSDTGELWAAGQKGFLAHSLGDANWEEVQLQDKLDYDLLGLWGSASVYVAVGVELDRQGPVMLISTDKGKTWSKRNVAISYNGLRSVFGVGGDIFVSSFGGTVYRSRDEGKTWQEEFFAGNELGRIWGTNDELFVVGSGGTILHWK